MSRKIISYFTLLFVLISCQKEDYNLELKSLRGNKLFKSTYSTSIPYCNGNFNNIGGGSGYSDILSFIDADIYINGFSTIQNFKNTIENAPNGSIIFINSNLTIDLTGMYNQTGEPSITIPPGVTIASSRGASGSMGALIKTDDYTVYNKSAGVYVNGGEYRKPLFVLGGNNIRVSGLRFQGPDQSIGAGDYLYNQKTCIYTNDFEYLEIDNCEFFGWPEQAVQIGGTSNSNSHNGNLIHHNHFYNNRQDGFGYGVVIYSGFAKIYANVMYANRHDIAGGGQVGSGYEAYCNIVKPGTISHNFDMHAEGNDDQSSNAGSFTYIHHNEFRDKGESRYDNSTYNIRLRGRPDNQFRVENNIFYYSGPSEAIRQSNGYGGYGNLIVLNNVYNSDAYLGWYVKDLWSKYNITNFYRFPSTNDALMTEPTGDYSAYNYNFTFGDYDGDGFTDIFKLENGKLYTIPHDCSQNGLNTQWQEILSTGYQIDQMNFGFFNSDNKTDIVVQDGNTLYVSWGSNSSWSHLKTLPTGVYLSEFKTGDMDGDYIDDFLWANGVNWTAIYNPSGTGQLLNTSGYDHSLIKLGRFNSDAKYDVFTSTGTEFLVSYGAITSWNTIGPFAISFNLLDVSDFNGDNTSDVIDKNSRYIFLSGTSSPIQAKTSYFPLSTFSFGNF